MNHVTLQEWISLLKTATESQDLEIEKGTKYCPESQTQIDQMMSQLTLPQIVDISLEKFKELREEYLKNERRETDYLNQTADLADYTLKLIAAWEIKRNHTIKQLLRKFALILSALLSVVLIGIPFFLKLREADKKFKAEAIQLKQSIHQGIEDNTHALLLKKLENIPSILKEIKERYKDHRRQELINDQLLADWEDYEKIPSESRPLYDEEFERDIKRGACFLRIDRTLNIKDQTPLPFHHLESHQRVKEAASFLQELLKKSEDQRWSPILQMSITHASLLTAFQAALSAVNINVANVQWESNGKYYSIKSIFSDQFPPIILEIIRHPKTGTIEMVHVTVKGSMDIVSYQINGNENPKMIVPNVITEELKYSIAFDENHRPVISNLHSQMDASIS